MALVLALLVRSIVLPVWSPAGAHGAGPDGAHPASGQDRCEPVAMAHESLVMAGEAGCCEPAQTPHCAQGLCVSVVACLSAAQALRVDGRTPPPDMPPSAFSSRPLPPPDQPPRFL